MLSGAFHRAAGVRYPRRGRVGLGDGERITNTHTSACWKPPWRGALVGKSQRSPWGRRSRSPGCRCPASGWRTPTCCCWWWMSRRDSTPLHLHLSATRPAAAAACWRRWQHPCDSGEEMKRGRKGKKTTGAWTDSHRVALKSSAADVGQLIDPSSRRAFAWRWKHPLTPRHTVILLQTPMHTVTDIRKKKKSHSKGGNSGVPTHARKRRDVERRLKGSAAAGWLLRGLNETAFRVSYRVSRQHVLYKRAMVASLRGVKRAHWNLSKVERLGGNRRCGTLPDTS